MRKLLIFAVVLCVLTSCSGSKNENDFRNAKWGMSMKQVLQSEGAEKNTGVYDDLFQTHDFLGEYSVLVSFHFDGFGQLSSGDYLTDRNLTKEQLDKFVKDMQKDLSDKYGKPVKTVDGNLSWETSRTFINLYVKDIYRISGKFDQTSGVIEYVSKEKKIPEKKL